MVVAQAKLLLRYLYRKSSPPKKRSWHICTFRHGREWETSVFVGWLERQRAGKDYSSHGLENRHLFVCPIYGDVCTSDEVYLLISGLLVYAMRVDAP